QPVDRVALGGRDDEPADGERLAVDGPVEPAGPGDRQRPRRRGGARGTRGGRGGGGGGAGPRGGGGAGGGGPPGRGRARGSSPAPGRVSSCSRRRPAPVRAR